MKYSRSNRRDVKRPPPSTRPITRDCGLQVYIQTRMITASKFAPSWPPSASPNTLNHRLQVYLQTRSITASKCISNLAQSQTPSVSSNSLNYCLQVHLQTRSITASKWISKLARLWPPCSHDYRLQVHLWVHSISASKCISQHARSRPRFTSLVSDSGCQRTRGNGGGRSLNRHLQAHLELLTITVCYQSRYTVGR